MSDFFSSDQVQNSIMELTMLQQQLVTEMPYISRMNYNQKVEHLSSEHTRLSKYEDDEKTNLIASIAADETEAETLSKESLSTLRLLKNKIASKPSEAPPARGSVGNQPPPDFTKMSKEDRKKNWSNILNQYKRN